MTYAKGSGFICSLTYLLLTEVSLKWTWYHTADWNPLVYYYNVRKQTQKSRFNGVSCIKSTDKRSAVWPFIQAVYIWAGKWLSHAHKHHAHTKHTMRPCPRWLGLYEVCPHLLPAAGPGAVWEVTAEPVPVHVNPVFSSIKLVVLIKSQSMSNFLSPVFRLKKRPSVRFRISVLQRGIIN